MQKGLGRARIHWRGKKIDLFTTHLIAYHNDVIRDTVNDLYRKNQAKQAYRVIKNSNADVKILSGTPLPRFLRVIKFKSSFVLLSGDFNEKPNEPVHRLFSRLMTDSLLDKHPRSSFDNRAAMPPSTMRAIRTAPRGPLPSVSTT